MSQNNQQMEIVQSQTVKVCGVSENAVKEQIHDLAEGQSNPVIVVSAKNYEVEIRVTAAASSEDDAKSRIKTVVKELKKRFGDSIFTTREDETLEMAVVRLLRKYELTVTTAESCTGGLVAGRLVNVPGVSEVFHAGFVTYSNKAKRKFLDVSKSTLKKYDAVSPETAKEMAAGGVLATDADTCVAVTGLAGPDGGTEERPVGLVYIAAYMKDKVSVEEYHFDGNREEIREQAVVHALDLLRRSILENYR